MAYIRPMDKQLGLYIYPEDDGIRFMSFPNHSNEIIPDEMLDILLTKMSYEEINDRKNHGRILLKSLADEDYDSYKKLKSFSKYKEEMKNESNR